MIVESGPRWWRPAGFNPAEHLPAFRAGGVKQQLVTGARGRRGFEGGDLELGTWSAGLVQGIINDVPTVAELIERIVTEACELIAGGLAVVLRWAGRARPR
uniref:hypothetical protein n=1 Tax=Amycolatopsis thermoflava TaxID=84480 RepID=UPI00268FE84A